MAVIFVKEKWAMLPVSLHRLRYSGSLRGAFRPHANISLKVLALLNIQAHTETF
jgi:hypothetical protein